MSMYEQIMESLQTHIEAVTEIADEIAHAVAEDPAAPMDSFEARVSSIETQFQAVQKTVTRALGGNSMSADELSSLNYKYMECNGKLRDIRKCIARYEQQEIAATETKDLSPEDLTVGYGDAGPAKSYRQVRMTAMAAIPNFLAPTGSGTPGSVGAVQIPPQSSPSVVKPHHAPSLLVSNLQDVCAPQSPDQDLLDVRANSASGNMRKSSNPDLYKKHAEDLNKGINKLRSNLIALNRAANEPETITEALTGMNPQDARLVRDTKKVIAGSESVAQITANLRRENISLKEELGTLRTRTKQQEEEIIALKKNLSVQTKTVEKQTDDIEILQTSVERLTEERQSLSATLREKMRALADLRKQLDTVSDQNKELAGLLELERGDRTTVISELRADLNHYKTENEVLRDRLKTLDELNVEGNVLELERVTADIEDMQNVIRQLKRQKVELTNKFAREKELLQENIDVLEAQLASGYLETEKGAPSHAEVVMLEQEVIKRDIEIKRLRALVSKAMSDKDEAMALFSRGSGDSGAVVSTDAAGGAAVDEASEFRTLGTKHVALTGPHPAGRLSFLHGPGSTDAPNLVVTDVGRGQSTLSMLLSQKTGTAFGASGVHAGTTKSMGVGYPLGREVSLHNEHDISRNNDAEEDDLDVAALVRRKRDKRLSVIGAHK